jgi:hypothetical protein
MICHFSETFFKQNNRAIDEVWYRRAVEQVNVDPESFIYSIPHRRYEKYNNEQVTVSHAVFLKEHMKLAPVAVVAYKFNHSSLIQLVQNITGTQCGPDCTDYFTENNLKPYILDDNGYILYSKILNNHGRFFGVVEGWLMKLLIEEKIYKEIVVYDYQGVCYQEKSDSKSWMKEKMDELKYLEMISLANMMTV